jgi:dihydropteroate synthase
MTNISPHARLYLRPTCFMDAPFGYDGQFERLAGGLQFFAAWEVIAVEGGVRNTQQLVTVDRMDDFLSGLTIAQQDAARGVIANVLRPRAALELGERIVRLDQPQVMGILNMTPDSFSGGSAHLDDPSGAAGQAYDMAKAGAAIIDIGGESTRPGASLVWEEDEKKRVLPVIQALANSGLALSLDTRKAGVMQTGLDAGAHMINDVSALMFEPPAVDVVKTAACPVVLMHYPGTPEHPHEQDHYNDPLLEVYDWLESRVEAVVAAGVARDRIILDPGIGFGKGVSHNLALMNGLALFHGLGCPLLLGVSRKRLIGALSNEAPADERLPGSLTLAMKGVEQGVQILRVHDVPETLQSIRVWRGLRDQALSVV